MTIGVTNPSSTLYYYRIWLNIFAIKQWMQNPQVYRFILYEYLIWICLLNTDIFFAGPLVGWALHTFCWCADISNLTFPPKERTQKKKIESGTLSRKLSLQCVCFNQSALKMWKWSKTFTTCYFRRRGEQTHLASLRESGLFWEGCWVSLLWLCILPCRPHHFSLRNELHIRVCPLRVAPPASLAGRELKGRKRLMLQVITRWRPDFSRFCIFLKQRMFLYFGSQLIYNEASFF